MALHATSSPKALRMLPPKLTTSLDLKKLKGRKKDMESGAGGGGGGDVSLWPLSKQVRAQRSMYEVSQDGHLFPCASIF